LHTIRRFSWPFIAVIALASGCGSAGSSALPGGDDPAAGGSAAASGQAGADVGGQAGTDAGGQAGADAGSGGSGATGTAGAGAGQGGSGPAGAGQGGSGPAGAGQGGSGPAGAGQGGSGGAAGAGGSSSCPAESVFVYVLTNTQEVYKFYPPTLTFTKLGTLDCGSDASPYSMAVARNGTAYSIFNDGNLYSFGIPLLKCTKTSFEPGQHGFDTFGMGFSSQGPDNETLYVANADGSGLGRIDLTTMKLAKVGDYDKISARAELTGTGEGKLFGAFEGNPYVVAEIDKTSAAIVSQAKQDAINYSASSSNFAFAFWGGDFWIFVGPGGATDVFQYDPVAGQTSKVSSVDFEIVGAGVSTCAPIHKL
jgi:hypothetical protein